MRPKLVKLASQFANIAKMTQSRVDVKSSLQAYFRKRGPHKSHPEPAPSRGARTKLSLRVTACAKKVANEDTAPAYAFRVEASPPPKWQCGELARLTCPALLNAMCRRYPWRCEVMNHSVASLRRQGDAMPLSKLGHKMWKRGAAGKASRTAMRERERGQAT